MHPVDAAMRMCDRTIASQRGRGKIVQSAGPPGDSSPRQAPPSPRLKYTTAKGTTEYTHNITIICYSVCRWPRCSSGVVMCVGR
jgi:hypothetical protein